MSLAWWIQCRNLALMCETYVVFSALSHRLPFMSDEKKKEAEVNGVSWHMSEGGRQKLGFALCEFSVMTFMEEGLGKWLLGSEMWALSSVLAAGMMDVFVTDGLYGIL